MMVSTLSAGHVRWKLPVRRLFGSLRAWTAAASIVAALATSISGVSASQNSVALTAGSLSITGVPSNFAYPSTALTGAVITLALPTAFAVSVNDARGSGAGWHLLASVDAPLTSGSDVIPAINHTVTGVTASGVVGTAPTNSTTYPYTFPTTASSLFNAATLTGRGQSTMTFGTQLVVPADANVGAYSQTLTVSIVAGP